MISAVFTRNGANFVGVRISGHADYAKHGQDIVCASVTSALQLTANAITEILKIDGALVVKKKDIVVTLPQNSTMCAYHFIHALYLHLQILSERYAHNINITVLEV